MSMFVVAEELQTACNCRQQVGVSVEGERGRQQEQAVIRGLQLSPTPGPWELPGSSSPCCAPTSPQLSPWPLQSLPGAFPFWGV